MASNTNSDNASTSEQSLKLAVAISLRRSKFFRTQTRFPAAPPPESDALRWKRKAKERKQEILRLRDGLKEAEGLSLSGHFQLHFVSRFSIILVLSVLVIFRHSAGY